MAQELAKAFQELTDDLMSVPKGGEDGEIPTVGSPEDEWQTTSESSFSARQTSGSVDSPITGASVSNDGDNDENNEDSYEETFEVPTLKEVLDRTFMDRTHHNLGIPIDASLLAEMEQEDQERLGLQGLAAVADQILQGATEQEILRGSPGIPQGNTLQRTPPPGQFLPAGAEDSEEEEERVLEEIQQTLSESRQLETLNTGDDYEIEQTIQGYVNPGEDVSYQQRQEESPPNTDATPTGTRTSTPNKTDSAQRRNELINQMGRDLAERAADQIEATPPRTSTTSEERMRQIHIPTPSSTQSERNRGGGGMNLTPRRENIITDDDGGPARNTRRQIQQRQEAPETPQQNSGLRDPRLAAAKEANLRARQAARARPRTPEAGRQPDYGTDTPIGRYMTGLQKKKKEAADKRAAQEQRQQREVAQEQERLVFQRFHDEATAIVMENYQRMAKAAGHKRLFLNLETELTGAILHARNAVAADFPVHMLDPDYKQHPSYQSFLRYMRKLPVETLETYLQSTIHEIRTLWNQLQRWMIAPTKTRALASQGTLKDITDRVFRAVHTVYLIRSAPPSVDDYGNIVDHNLNYKEYFLHDPVNEIPSKAARESFRLLKKYYGPIKSSHELIIADVTQLETEMSLLTPAQRASLTETPVRNKRVGFEDSQHRQELRERGDARILADQERGPTGTNLRQALSFRPPQNQMRVAPGGGGDPEDPDPRNRNRRLADSPDPDEPDWDDPDTYGRQRRQPEPRGAAGGGRDGGGGRDRNPDRNDRGRDENRGARPRRGRRDDSQDDEGSYPPPRGGGPPGGRPPGGPPGGPPYPGGGGGDDPDDDDDPGPPSEEEDQEEERRRRRRRRREDPVLEGIVPHGHVRRPRLRGGEYPYFGLEDEINGHNTSQRVQNGDPSNNVVMVYNPATAVNPDDVPKFEGGDRTEYVTFRINWNEAQKIMIANHWSEIRRLEFLKSRLGGEALGFVKALPPMKGVLAEALAMLDQAYGLKRAHVIRIIEKLLTETPPASNSPNSRIRVIQAAFTVLQTFQALGIDSKTENRIWFFVFLRGKLDRVMTKAYQDLWRRNEDLENPLGSRIGRMSMAKALLTKIREEQDLRDRERGGDGGNKQKQNNKNKKGGGKDNSSLPLNFQTRSTESQEGASAQAHATQKKSGGGSKENCPIPECGKPKHPLWRCRAFRKLQPNQRESWAAKSKACRLCLNFHQHEWKDCNYQACGYDGCAGKHNKLLHREKGQSNQTRAQEKPAEQEHRQAHLTKLAFNTQPSGVNAYWPKSIINAIVVWAVPAGSKDFSRALKVRALVDSCSEVDLIKRVVARDLGLPSLGKYNLDLKGTGATLTPLTEEDIVRVDLYDRNFRERFTLEAVTISEIGDPLPKIPFDPKEFPHLRKVSFFETYPSDSPREIHMLLSEHSRTSILTGQFTKGKSGEPVALGTRLGPALGGSYWPKA